MGTRMRRKTGVANWKEIKDFIPAIFLFVFIDVLALLTVGPYEASGVTAFSSPNNPADIVYLFLALLMVTLAFLLIARFWKKQLIQMIVLGSVALTVFSMLFAVTATFFPEEWALFLSITAAVVLVIALVRYPEWYVVDTCGIILGAAVIGILGISLNVFLVIILLIGLAIYDAVSVYVTKHMINLAEIVLDLKLPVVLVIPRTRDYSLIGDKINIRKKPARNRRRKTFFVGLGDIIMPGILVASTFHSIASNGLLVALSVMLGTIVGLIFLTRKAMKGTPQAGLPFLCSGAILGYLLSSYILFGKLACLFL
jgi:presenilin-like A22 family membrane protease